MAPSKSPGKFSPHLMKPSDLFVLKRKRKGSPSTQLSESGPRKKLFVSPLKCINFNSPAKNYKSPKLSRRKGTPRKTPKKTPRKVVTEESSVPLSDLLDEDANIEAPTICKKEINDGLIRIPIDWTLKTRLRFFSYKPFPFKGYFTATENATGTTSFVRCIPTTVSKDSSQGSKPPPTLKPSLSSSSLMSIGDTTATVDMSATALLKKHCFVWRFPHLPGFDLFPRINNRCKLAPISRLMSEDLLHEYCSSLKDLYDLIRARQCAYFYLCAHSFTALFQAPGVGGIDEIHAYITPTSEGFRKMLKEEGIEFSMPLLEREIELSKQKEAADAEKEKALNEETFGPSMLDEDEDASNFLESIGVSIQESSSINKPKRTKNQVKRNVNSTCVLIKGSNVQDLIPFLSTSKIILTTTGSLAYIPPTLLSPVAFEGAQLHFLKLKQNNMSEKTSSMYSLEIRGPILPNMVDSLCELFKTTLGDFNANLVNYDYCTPMATIHSIGDNEKDKKDDSSKTIFASESLRDCGLGEQFINDLCCKSNQSTNSQTSISYKSGKYFVK